MLSDKVLECIGLTIESYGRAVSDGVLGLWIDDLSRFPEKKILEALKRYRANRSNDRAPNIGQIIAIIELVEEDGRPNGEEAWAIIKPLIGDEQLSAIVTHEMQSAYPAAHNLGKDFVGARMAFIDVYKRLVEEARARKAPCVWLLWVGDNKDHRAEVAQQGVADGRLKHSHVRQWLPAPTIDHLQAVDLIRENIDRTDLGLTALPDTRSLEETRTLAQRRLSEIKAKHFSDQTSVPSFSKPDPVSPGTHKAASIETMNALCDAPNLWKAVNDAQEIGESANDAIEEWAKKHKLAF